MSELISRFTALPAYGIGALIVLLLYGLQSEIRFGSRARKVRAGESDRKSTLLVAASSAVPVLGFVLAMKAGSPAGSMLLPQWFRHALIPGLPGVAWMGVAFGICGLGLRLWAVLTLRDRYTRTLLVQDEHSVERGGPYQWVRHPGYLGSLLCLNGIAVASGNSVTLLASLATTWGAYSYRIRVEDAMLVAAFGRFYGEYRRQVRALVPSFRSSPLPVARESTPNPLVAGGAARRRNRGRGGVSRLRFRSAVLRGSAAELLRCQTLRKSLTNNRPGCDAGVKTEIQDLF